MPGGDRTGPMGAGPMTGRGVGLCAGYTMPGYMNPAYGRGFRGGGGGRGWRHQYYATGLPGWARGGAYAYPGGFPAAAGTAPTSKAAGQEELRYLQEQSQYLKEALEDIETRISELGQEAGIAGKVQKEEKK